MTGWLRRGGRGRLQDGSAVTWSVAEGARGRRWRWTVAGEDGLRSSGLLERDIDDRFARLELATAGGLLTFHPDRDGREAHGNVLTRDGVGPIAVDWDPGWGIGFADDPFGSAIGGWSGFGLIVDPRIPWRWGEADIDVLPLDDRRVPVLDDPAEWPLEQ
jgi:hypothetical protein